MVHSIVRVVCERGHSGKRWMRTRHDYNCFFFDAHVLSPHTILRVFSLAPMSHASKMRDCVTARALD